VAIFVRQLLQERSMRRKLIIRVLYNARSRTHPAGLVTDHDLTESGVRRASKGSGKKPVAEDQSLEATPNGSMCHLDAVGVSSHLVLSIENNVVVME